MSDEHGRNRRTDDLSANPSLEAERERILNDPARAGRLRWGSAMSRKRQDKGRMPPFVALIKTTLASPAWRAMSHGARSLFVALKNRYSGKNNGRIFLSQRDARKELRGSGFTEIAAWFQELQHYGFIVQVTPGCLGVDGKGKAPHWRLTDVPMMHDPPTNDFNRWDGIKFKRRPRQKKQNPAPENWSAPLQKSGTPRLQKAGAQCGTSDPESWSIQPPPRAPEIRSISRLPLPSASEACSEPGRATRARPHGAVASEPAPAVDNPLARPERSSSNGGRPSSSPSSSSAMAKRGRPSAVRSPHTDWAEQRRAELRSMRHNARRMRRLGGRRSDLTK